MEYCILAYVKRFNLSKDATRYLSKLVSLLFPNIIRKNTLHNQEDLKCLHFCEKCNVLFRDDPNDIECVTNGSQNFKNNGNLSAQTKATRQPRKYKRSGSTSFRKVWGLEICTRKMRKKSL